MEPPDRDRLPDFELAPLFPENSVPAAPLFEDGTLPSPSDHLVIPLPIREPRPRVVIADDDIDVIDGLGRSLEANYSKALDVRFCTPRHDLSFVDQIKAWMKGGWRPDAVVIDINMDVGGRHGVHYLQELREQEGCAALAVVLTTGNQYRDLDEGRLTVGRNLTRDDPGKWLERARKYEPEGLLYGKTADRLFLGRIGEHLPEWREVARRRAWVRLLGKVAEVLDGASIKVETVARQIVRYAVAEMEVDDAFVRWRRDSDRYELVAAATTREQSYVEEGNLIDPKNVPVLQDILGNVRSPVVKDALGDYEAGIFAPHIARHRFLGVGMVLGNRTVGFITLLRDPGNRPFEGHIDGQHLAVLARLLASALGRDALMRGRQTRLLAFANTVAQASQIDAICHALATTLHQELHDSNNTTAKTTVRLLDFGKGVLRRSAQIGMPSAQHDIAITETASIYADCVRRNLRQRIPDVSLARWKAVYLNLCVVDSVHSELCVPLTIGEDAIGAVNNEHLDVDFYRAHDEDFVQAAAGLAASAIERIRTTHVLDGMTDFVHRFAAEDTTALDRRLRDLLYDYCSYTVLVDLEITAQEPWMMRHVECKFVGANQGDVRRQLADIYADRWHATWVSKLYRERSWQHDWARFTKNESEFLHVSLANQDGLDVHQTADALLWLRHGDAPPHRALLLMWYLPPPLNLASVAVLGSLARLFSELDKRQHHIRDLIESNLIGEQAAQIGHVMQHFRHRLGNLTGSVATHIDRVEAAHHRGHEDDFNNAMYDLRVKARDIANSFHKSQGYVKKPRVVAVLIRDLIDGVLTSTELSGRLTKVAVNLDLPEGLHVHTDIDITSLVLYSLLENALDALEGRDNPTLTLRAEQRGHVLILTVADNGLGVQLGMRQHLFEWGSTTKSNGLGSALAFARSRMRLLEGDVIFAPNQPAIGALFEIQFSSDPLKTRP